MELAEFDKKYPKRRCVIKGGAEFRYRYVRNTISEETLVFLVGTVGISDVFAEHFDLLSKSFSVLTFDYPMELETCAQLVDGIAELFRVLGIDKAWLCGQSLGGFLAQIMAVRHPGAVAGLILSNTASLYENMGPEAEKYLLAMAAKQRQNRTLVSFLPMDFVKKKMFSIAKSVSDGYTAEQAKRSEAISAVMSSRLTRKYLLHMLGLLVDLPAYQGMHKEQFEYLKGRVLLLLSPDDTMFCPECAQSLISLMPQPEVDRSFTGGHMAIFLAPERYSHTAAGFVIADRQ